MSMQPLAEVFGFPVCGQDGSGKSVICGADTSGSADDLLCVVDEICNDFMNHSDLAERKTRGQFFTPKEVACFMSGLFDIDEAKRSLGLLDAGAGTGMLGAALCRRILNLDFGVSLHVDAYENDPKVLPYLMRTLEKCKVFMQEKGHEFSFEIIEKDFVMQNPCFLKTRSLFASSGRDILYDFAISNPPYYKLNRSSAEAVIMKEFVSGQPNIYAFFMALSLQMLKPDGQMVFITPRSFCSGLYFQRFRKWLLRNGRIMNLHVFESRKDIFAKMDVLQENVITRLTPLDKTENSGKEEVVVSSSRDMTFSDMHTVSTGCEDIVHRKNGDVFIKIPSSRRDIEVGRVMDSLGNTIEGLGLRASTGPVVSFRARRFLTDHSEKGSVPLLWMHNLNGFEVLWPIDKKNKPDSIVLNEESKKLLLPVRNYVLVKRFSSKEQERRLYAAVMCKTDFDYERIGIENHLNYICRVCGELDPDEAFGIAAILNTSLVDTFFRMINGNTQVNVVDIRCLPLPSIEKVREIGRIVRCKKLNTGSVLDEEVLSVLDIDQEILQMLNSRLNGSRGA